NLIAAGIPLSATRCVPNAYSKTTPLTIKLSLKRIVRFELFVYREEGKVQVSHIVSFSTYPGVACKDKLVYTRLRYIQKKKRIE
ncbi:MAG: hypothetical protein Q4D34_07145, partial [Eggerthellaceae bacterium]|nr:hypothetical protein [Eggerthellaceae bacterium]